MSDRDVHQAADDDAVVPEGAPDPATVAEAEDANPPGAGPVTRGVSDPSDPVANRDDATGR